MLTIIGCGNPNRSDDGVGVVVAQRLRDRVAAEGLTKVRVFDAGTAGMEVMFQARGATRLIVIDACRSGSPPGSLFEVPGEALEDQPPHSFNLHDFRWDHALHAGRQIFKETFPAEVTVFLIEAANLDFGLDLSPEVAATADRVTERLTAIIATETGTEDHVGAA